MSHTRNKELVGTLITHVEGYSHGHKDMTLVPTSSPLTGKKLTYRVVLDFAQAVASASLFSFLAQP